MTDDEAWARAKYHTLRTVRKYPAIFRWYESFGERGENAEHGKVVATWLRRSGLLYEARRRRDKRVDALTKWVENYFDDYQPRVLTAAWNAAVRSEAWATLTPAARWVYRLVHALAQERDGVGGSSVLLANRVALHAIGILGGPSYTSLATITNARVDLVRAGLVTVRVGQRGGRATRYTLPTDQFDLTELAPEHALPPPPPYELAHPEIRVSSVGSWEEVPRFTRQQRAELDEVFAAQRQGLTYVRPFAVEVPQPQPPVEPDPVLAALLGLPVRVNTAPGEPVVEDGATSCERTHEGEERDDGELVLREGTPRSAREGSTDLQPRLGARRLQAGRHDPLGSTVQGV